MLRNYNFGSKHLILRVMISLIFVSTYNIAIAEEKSLAYDFERYDTTHMKYSNI